MVSQNPRLRRSRERVYRKGHCCWCGKPLPPPPSRRTSWCSDECVKEYLAQDPKELRREVEKRDRGICSGCGHDTEALRRRLEERLAAFRAQPAVYPAQIRALRWDRFLRRFKLMAGTCYLRYLWEADHIRPVCEGGENTLANLRTLCVPCHKRETRELAARRAAARRTA